MYKSFFHLNRLPFSISPDPRFLLKMPHTLEALACLTYGISNRSGFIVLTGEVGTGKTTLIHRTIEELGSERMHSAFIFNPRLDIMEFLDVVLADFGIVVVNRSKSGMLMQLNRWLIERYKSGETCVLFVDEAQNLSLELLEEIRLLTNLETTSEKLLQIVLSGQPEFEARLDEPAVRQLRQRISMWCRTRVLTEDETAAYIRERLAIAGTQDPIFSSEAAKLVHRYSQGIPRTINVICEHALIQCYAVDLSVVPPEVISSVAQDLGLQRSSVSRVPHHAEVEAYAPRGTEREIANRASDLPQPQQNRGGVQAHE